MIASARNLRAAALVVALAACAGPNDWPAYRYVELRDGNQPTATALSDPGQVGTLAVRWTYPPTGRDLGNSS